MEYPFKDLMPLDEVLAREGYYKDWTHLDPEVFYSLTQISEYIKTKGYGVDVRLLIAQLAEHFGLKSTQIVDLANLLSEKHDALKAQFDDVIANATVDSEVILARGGKATLGQRLDETTAQLAQKAEDNEVRKKSNLITVDDVDSEFLSAIQGGTSVEVNSVPKEQSVSVDKLEQDLVDLIGLEIYGNLYDGSSVQGNINKEEGHLVNTGISTSRATDFIAVSDNMPIITNLNTFKAEYTINFYDINKIHLGYITSTGKEIMPLKHTAYIRTNLKFADTYDIPTTELKIYQVFNSVKDTANTNKHDLSELSYALEYTPKKELFNLDKTNRFLISDTTGLIVPNTETPSYLSVTTDIEPDMPVKTNLLEVRTLGNKISQTGLFYRDDEYLGKVVTETDTFIPPQGANKFAQNLKTLSTLDLKVGEFRIWQEGYFSSVNDDTPDYTELFKNNFKYNDMTHEKYKVFAIDFDDGVLDDDEIISQAINFSKHFGYRVIVLDTRIWRLNKSIELPANTILVVDGVIIKQNDGVFDTVIRGDNVVLNSIDPGDIPERVDNIENIKIIGVNGAEIHGPDVFANGENPHTKRTEDKTNDTWGWATLQISLSKCTNFEVSGFKFERQQCWATSFDQCKNGKIHDLEVNSNFPGILNGDGVDIRFGCKNIDVYDIRGHTQDDTVAMTCFPYNGGTRYSLMEPSAKDKLILSDEDRTISNIRVENITASSNIHSVICCVSGGFKVRDVFINDIKPVASPNNRPVISLYSWSVFSGQPSFDGDVSNVSINDVVSINAASTLGTRELVVDNVWLNKAVQKNAAGEVVDLYSPLGVTVTNSKVEL